MNHIILKRQKVLETPEGFGKRRKVLENAGRFRKTNDIMCFSFGFMQGQGGERGGAEGHWDRLGVT